MARKKKQKCHPRKPWAYPAGNKKLDTPHWANACSCGWNTHGHKTEEEAQEKLKDHLKNS